MRYRDPTRTIHGISRYRNCKQKKKPLFFSWNSSILSKDPLPFTGAQGPVFRRLDLPTMAFHNPPQLLTWPNDSFSHLDTTAPTTETRLTSPLKRWYTLFGGNKMNKKQNPRTKLSATISQREWNWLQTLAIESNTTASRILSRLIQQNATEYLEAERKRDEEEEQPL